jgi:hypothetical protein
MAMVAGVLHWLEVTMGEAITLKRVIAAIGLVLAAIGLLGAVVNGFSAPPWVTPAAVLALAIVLVV